MVFHLLLFLLCQHFTEKKELISFSVVVHTYHQILVDANAVLLAGDLTPPEECLLIGKNGQKTKIQLLNVNAVI